MGTRSCFRGPEKKQGTGVWGASSNGERRWGKAWGKPEKKKGGQKLTIPSDEGNKRRGTVREVLSEAPAQSCH